MKTKIYISEIARIIGVNKSTISRELKYNYSWERGINENTNGLIRQFLPKSMSLDNVNKKVIQTI